jgi:cytochrome c oxidase subunit 1
MFGRMYDFKKAYAAAIMLTTGFVVHYMPMFVLGLQGMPRRYYDYLPQFEGGNFISGLGAYLMAFAIALMFYNLFASLRKGERAPGDPWGGTTLEWTLPSPPSPHNFEEQPAVKSYPYDFTDVVENARKS